MTMVRSWGGRRQPPTGNANPPVERQRYSASKRQTKQANPTDTLNFQTRMGLLSLVHPTVGDG